MAVETKQAALDCYEISEKLGEGTYGVVYKAKLRNSKPEHIVALKKIKIDPNDEGIPATTIRELSLLNVCKHPCIVKLEKSLCIKGELWLVFEYVKNDLKKYLDGLRSPLKTRALKILSYMLIEGVKFCHARRILHRDLKPQNILISQDGQLKIADFGLGLLLLYLCCLFICICTCVIRHTCCCPKCDNFHNFMCYTCIISLIGWLLEM